CLPHRGLLMTFTNRIEINPRVKLGKPVIRGTRIPVELILRKLSEGASAAELFEAYPRLACEDIEAAVGTRRAASLRTAEGTDSSFWMSIGKFANVDDRPCLGCFLIRQ